MRSPDGPGACRALDIRRANTAAAFRCSISTHLCGVHQAIKHKQQAVQGLRQRQHCPGAATQQRLHHCWVRREPAGHAAPGQVES